MQSQREGYKVVIDTRILLRGNLSTFTCAQNFPDPAGCQRGLRVQHDIRAADGRSGRNIFASDAAHDSKLRQVSLKITRHKSWISDTCTTDSILSTISSSNTHIPYPNIPLSFPSCCHTIVSDRHLSRNSHRVHAVFHHVTTSAAARPSVPAW